MTRTNQKNRSQSTTGIRKMVTGGSLGKMTYWTSIWLLAFLLLGPNPCVQAKSFFLKNKDRVVFYGDSITQQRYYPVAVQTFVRTRFPQLHVQFVDSGVGGDRVGGGWAGPIDLRLKRDVFPFKPNVVTIMLGMNDGTYQPFNQRIFDIYKKGYRHIIASLQAHLPGVKIVLIQPSPYDNYSAALPPHNRCSTYNDVMIRYGQFVKQLAATNHFSCVDFNTPLVDLIQQIKKINPRLATRVIPGRVHPGATGHMVMAQTLLAAWNAPAIVTATAINAATKAVVKADNTKVSALKVDGPTISWTQADQALPYPMMTLHAHWRQFPPIILGWGGLRQNMKFTNSLAVTALRLVKAYQTLDEEPLQVTGLSAGDYRLQINGQDIGTFKAAQLAAGINLARYNTPMMAQAFHVLDLVWQQTEYRFYTWRNIQMGLPNLDSNKIQALAQKLVAAMYQHIEKMDETQYAAAQPQVDHYVLTAVK